MTCIPAHNSFPLDLMKPRLLRHMLSSSASTDSSEHLCTGSSTYMASRRLESKETLLTSHKIRMPIYSHPHETDCCIVRVIELLAAGAMS